MINREPSFQENVFLKKFCTYGIGGPAQYFLTIHTTEEMQGAIHSCFSNELPYFILGKGSNVLFDDRGFRGCVLLNKINFLEQPYPGVFHVGAGYSFSLFGAQTARQGWGGLEFASGIPGSVGGAIYMNAGANGHETCECLQSVDFVNEKGDLEVISKQDLTFSYRHSSFQKLKGAIVGATFQLQSDTSARKKQIDIINYRTQTQPYGDKSAGCVFVNPANNHAGSLIDRCGLKGFSIGGAAVSTLHANFFINSGEATSKEMLQLVQHVKEKVKAETGIDLKAEVMYIPYDREET